MTLTRKSLGAPEASSKHGARRVARYLRRRSIPVRVAALSAVLILAFIATNAIVIRELSRNSDRITAATELFGHLETANSAATSFGEVRYWMTDLAVSLLTISERNAEQARADLGRNLERLKVYDPEIAEEIARETDSYMDTALQAVDAYTAENRVIGNTLLAQARAHSQVVEEKLAQLVQHLHDDAWAARANAIAAARNAVNLWIIIAVAVGLLGLSLTVIVFRSIVLPLQRLNKAIGSIMEGRFDVDIPPSGEDEIGTMAKTVTLLRDNITERARLEDETRRQRQVIETAVETISEGFALFDSDDRLLLANTRFKAMYPELAEPGRRFEDMIRKVIARENATLDGLEPEEWVLRRLEHHRRAEGFLEQQYDDGRWMQISERRTPDNGTVSVYADITELKNRQDELEAAKDQADSASQAKSQFVANMSHELRTPLNAIIGYSEMLIEEAEDLDQREFVPDLEKIRVAGKHLLSLINDILDFSKIEAGKMEVLAETFSVEDLVSQVSTTISPLVAKNGNTLTVSPDAGLGTMRSDETKIRQILFNLLSNASKFTKAGEITLAARATADAAGVDCLEFKVTDTGIGMTHEQKDRLFQAFTQAEASTSRDYGGTGLGLTISKRFAQMLGGDVTVDTEIGKGATFAVTVPRNYSEREDEPVGNEPIDGERGLVLVVDDEPAARKVLADALSGEGYRVVTAAGGKEGLRLAREMKPGAIVLDIIMPDLDGWAVLRAVKADAELCDIPVILVTVMGDREMGLALGAAEHLTKPIESEELLRVLRRSAPFDGTTDILVVDDDSATRDILRRVLTREGWGVREAANGEAGLAEVARARPAVVLLDLMMPGMDGFEMLRALRQDKSTSELPVVIITSKDLTREEREWLSGNTLNMFQKGAYQRSHLVETLRRMVENARHPSALAKESVDGN
jgi:signal transduction histidine kinase/CheY-like chemotaxis protein